MLLVTYPLSALAIGGDPFTDAFSQQYKPMTDTEVSEKLNAVPLAPEGGGVLPQLSGKTYKITNDQSLSLELVFDASGAGVSLSADLPQAFGAPPTHAAFTTEYAGLASGDYVLVGFRMPNSEYAWTVVWDLKSGMAAAYEVFFREITGGWFAAPSREAQRNVYLGKVEGIGSSTKIPTATNHLTGKAVLWENDLGKFYTNYGTRSWSAFYPIGQPAGLAGSWTSPSDYYDFHDAHHFLYSRTESYYSGATLVELLDLHRMSQIGLKIGFDADDNLEFKLYSGTGKVLGSYAAYGGFAELEYPDNMFGRFAYRPNTEKLTREEVVEAIKDEGSWTGAFGGPGKEEKMYPLSDKLDGKSFSLSFDDGLILEYQFTGTNEMKFREKGAQAWKTGRYEAFEVDANLIFFTHAIDDDYPDKIYLNVVDFNNGLATCMNSEILVNEEAPRMCIPTFHFGVLNMAGITPVSQRHGFSNGLLGSSFTWTYNDSMVSQHYYATPDSLYYAIMQPSGEAILMWSCDAWYVKFRENVYLISWMESFGPGQNDSKVFNLNTMHDAGVCYGIPDGAPFEYNTYGSEARHAGTVDVSSIYGIKNQLYNITLDTNYGAATTGAITGTDGKLATLPTPTRNDYSFNGWFTAATGGTQITPSYVFDRDTVIYAQWTYIGGSTPPSVSPSSPGSSGGKGTDPGANPSTSTGSSTSNSGSQQQTGQAAASQTDGSSSLPALGSTTPTKVADFTDSGTVAAWAVPFMDRLISSAIMNGYSDGTLAPKGNVTRAEFTKLIVSSLQLSAGANAGNFSDVRGSDWFKSFVDIASSLGLINGVGEGSFAPNNQITRQDLCAIVYRAMQNIVTTLPSAEGERFSDDSRIAAYAKDAVYALRQAGIVSGRDDGRFDPSAFATREETAKIICGLMDYVATTGADGPAASTGQTAVDAVAGNSVSETVEGSTLGGVAEESTPAEQR
jgi:uncharacterized repeat protein (TIGR02543 family)